MCTLTYVPKGKIPTEQELINSCTTNPHGFGYAIIINGEIVIGKGLDYKKVVKEFMTLRRLNKGGDALFHSRLATHGEMTEANCHPFFVGGDKRTVLAHNGILPVPTYDERSDTRVFAEDIMPTYDKAGGLDNPVVFNAIERWAAGSKILILTVDPKFKQSVYLLNEKAGHYNNGVWWSNYGYATSYTSYGKEHSKSHKPSKSFKQNEIDYVYICSTCEAEIPEQDAIKDGYCFTCETCLLCGYSWDVCLCYTPSSSKTNRLNTVYEYENAGDIDEAWGYGKW